MKYLSRILITAVAAVGLTACYDDAGGIMPQELSKVGDVPVNISFSMTDKAATTRSIVGGEETPVSVMQLICFDANGKYLGIRKADVTNDNPAATGFYDSGVIKGAVPEGTSHIHFIANRDLTMPLSFSVGTDEETVMKGVELTSYYKDNKKVCYWGYHKEISAAAMKTWLNPPVSSTKKSEVYMIRDRARVILEYDKSEAKFDVTSIKWLIHNGHSRGYLAPKKAEWESYYGNSTIEGHTNDLISTATMNEFTAVVPGEQSRYTLWTSKSENEDATFDQNVAWNGTSNTLTPQFLFDDDNSAQQGTYPKIILKVTYNVTEGETTTSKTVYHVLKLKDNDDNQYDIVRNNTYYIKCKLLSPDVAYYETLKEAIDGEAFMDGEIEIDRSITEVNDGEKTLQILLPTETTAIVLNTSGNHEMHFAFRMASDVSQAGSTNPADFTVEWENTQTFCKTVLPVTYDPNTKQFAITATVKNAETDPDGNGLSDKLQDEWIVVKHNDTGLTRYIHVFVIDQFRYKIYPTLKLSKAASSGNPAEYVLHFQIPPMEHTKFLEDGTPDPNEPVYPQELYPIDVKFTTNTLNAYGISQGVNNYGLFGSSIESTEVLTHVANFEAGSETDPAYNDPVSSTSTSNITRWYFQQADNYWDFWYTYSLKTYPDKGDVYIYFKDVRDHIKYANVSDVGLFLYVEYFGKNYSVPGTNN